MSTNSRPGFDVPEFDVLGAVDAAMQVVDRRAFLPAHQQRWADQDRPLAIGHGQTNSQPSTVRAMLRLLAVHPGDHVLDVGAGSGWTTALLARLVGPTGLVLGVERDRTLAAWGARNVAGTGMTWASIVPAVPGELGRPRAGGWPRILVSAAAQTLPEALVEQLAPAGRMVVPVRHQMLLVARGDDPDAPPHVTEHGTYSFVPLIED